jgi:DNA ligase (NAD+)
MWRANNSHQGQEMLTDKQYRLIADYGLTTLSPDKISTLCQDTTAVHSISTTQLVEFLGVANSCYRSGAQIVSDADYDFIFLAELKKREPQHPFLHEVEPEPEAVQNGKTVKLPQPMLSTEKAYSAEEIQRWLSRVQKAALEINLDWEHLTFQATPKLDGFAAYDDGQHLYTRGDGKKGTDISRVIQRGLSIAGDGARGLGAGEIVVKSSYFKLHLAKEFENSRNFQASVVKEKELEPAAAQAIADKAAVFFPFSLLPCWQGRALELEHQLDDIVSAQLNAVDFDVDGVVFEVTDPQLKEYMGATRHHHRWQIALKNNLDSARVRVVAVHPQTSRSGRVNPVVEIEPTRLSGALIHRATAHHYGMVSSAGIGSDAIIELTRSGEVIPKIIRVIQATTAQIPQFCPSCGSELTWENDYLYCSNTSSCPAQISNTIEHFFRTIGNIDGFGPATIAKLYNHGVITLPAIYALQADDFSAAGFGPKQSDNLVEQLQRSRSEQIEDWRFLAALGIFRMGGGNCERLLKHYHLEQIFTLSVEQIIAIEGFAEKTAAAVVRELQRIQPLFNQLFALHFNLEPSPLITEQQASGTLSPIAGKLLVFTGAMNHGSRSEMQAQAKKLGAKVGSAISSKTDFLITGDNVGASKIAAAQEKNIQLLTEDEYLALLDNSD